MPPVRGHRLVAHTADVIVEAWGPDRTSCFAEAVHGLVSSFADAAGAPAAEEVPYELAAGDDASLLVALLDEVIYLLDARGVVTVGVTVAEGTGPGLRGTFATVPAGDVEATGAVPKAVSWHGVEVGPRDGGWRCRVVVDV